MEVSVYLELDALERAFTPLAPPLSITKFFNFMLCFLPSSLDWNLLTSQLNPEIKVAKAMNPTPPPFNFFIPTPTSCYLSPEPSSLLSTPSSSDMEASVLAVEEIINYIFRNKKLLEEALTHSSYTESQTYERLEFIGDAVLGLAVSNHLFLAYPNLDPGNLSLLRAANISTEKLARVAVRHGIHRYVRHNAPALIDKVREFVEAVSEEDDAVAYGGSVKAPKVLADIVESVAAAIYVDVDFDLKRLWVIFRGLLEPIVTLDDLKQQPQPVTMLFEFCQKQGKHVDIKHWRNGARNIASVYVDGQFVASASSEQKDIAKLDAAKAALHKLAKFAPANIGMLDYCTGIDGAFEIEAGKQKLHELCGKKKWPKPDYGIEKDEGPPHEKKFVCSVQIKTVYGILHMTGDEKSRVKDAENSAASLMIRALQESNYL